MHPTATPIAADTTYRDSLGCAAQHLGEAVENYIAIPATREAPRESLALATTLLQFFRKLLPASSDEVLDALTTLCLTETALHRLVQHADAGLLPSAQIVDVGADNP